MVVLLNLFSASVGFPDLNSDIVLFFLEVIEKNNSKNQS
jgi:hypothetical protein